jgi:hypothetical protein
LVFLADAREHQITVSRIRTDDVREPDRQPVLLNLVESADGSRFCWNVKPPGATAISNGVFGSDVEMQKIVRYGVDFPPDADAVGRQEVGG